jgi:sugar lactone lactonase YvrE
MDGIMKTRSNNSLTRWLALVVGLTMIPPAAFADKKKKKKDDTPVVQQKPNIENIDHRLINTKNLVWPLPPDIPRIKFVQEYFGEEAPKVPEGQKPQKKKQGWMDRLAGVPTTDSGQIKKDVIHLLGKPYGIGVDSHGRVYVADTYVGAIFVYDREKKETKILRNGVDARFQSVIGLTVDDADRVFAVDAVMRRVVVLGKDWKLETYFGDEQLGHPGGIAIDEANRLLYVADTGKDNIAVFDADNFKLLRTIGGSPKKVGGDDPGTLCKPSNVAVDKDGLVYVSDTMNNRIQIFDADGNFISMFGEHGDGPGYFARPKGVSLDSDGHIWVADGAQSRVQVFDKEGHLLAFFGLPGTLPGQLGVPSGLYVDKANRVFVTEQLVGRLQIFQYVTDTEAKALKDERDKKAPAVSAQTSSSPSVKAGEEKKP